MTIELKKLNAKIASLEKRTAKWRDEVQFCLIGCAQHAFESNNVDPCTRLVKALHGADSRALIHWIEKHMPAVWIKDEAKFRVNKAFKGEYDAVTLMASPWWEMATKAKNVASSVDCLDAVRQLIKRLEKEVADGTKEVAHVEAIGELKALCGRLTAVR